MMQHALKLWNCLRPVDVGALIERPRAIDNRPYKIYHIIFDFCNRPFLHENGICAPAGSGAAKVGLMAGNRHQRKEKLVWCRLKLSGRRFT